MITSHSGKQSRSGKFAIEIVVKYYLQRYLLFFFREAIKWNIMIASVTVDV